jgi:molybdopterin-containing oxidoreductase family iron-sulfur binding subunit
MDRRDFLKLIGVASGTGALAGCDLERKTEKLIPYLVPPEDGVIPGDATYKPTVCTECPAGCGLSVTIKEGRPTKLEGLTSHPVNDGALCVRGQASLSRLYHPDRIRHPLVRGEDGDLAPATWNEAYRRITDALGAQGESVFLSGRSTGSLSRLIDRFCSGTGVTRLPEFEQYDHAAVRTANRELFGRDAVPSYLFENADCVITLGADVIGTWLSPVEHLAQLAKAQKGDHFNWYHVESAASLTGASAAHRLVVQPGSEALLLACLIGELQARRVFTDRRAEEHLSSVPPVTIAEAAAGTGLHAEDIEHIIGDLLGAHDPLLVAGDTAVRGPGGVEVARMAALIQYATGMIGKTVDFSRANDFSSVGTADDLVDLAGRLENGGIGVLFLCGVETPSRLPGNVDFSQKIPSASLSVGMGVVTNGTLEKCDVVLPLSHALESWGDHDPGTGVVSSIQPAVEPMYDTRSAGDILLQLTAAAGNGAGADNYQTWLLESWPRRYGSSGTGSLIEKGYLRREPQSRGRVSLSARRSSYVLPRVPDRPALVVVPSVRFYDGRSRDLGLLNEIPDPLTSVTWDKWVSIDTETAAGLGVADGDWVELSADGWRAELPVKVQPGAGAGVLSVEEGTIPEIPAGLAVTGGVKAQKITNRGFLSFLAGAKKTETEGHIPLQHIPHHSHGHVEHREDITFFPLPDYPDYRWAMAIDLDRCTGCSACVAACYVENNFPVVGREEHLKGREMSWLAIQPYYNDDQSVELLPMMCQHCDNAPCEPVCPVFATYHNNEGLNAQVYNRCVGTRYCANNCPYKVRRFNWFDNNKPPEPLEKMFNPDLSVRDKGIMEKCSFCVQRIRKARDVAKDEGRKIGPDEVTTACEQTCPSEAIVFGNIKDENSRVAQWARSERSHQALEELGTGPAVYYLKRKGTVDEHHG